VRLAEIEFIDVKPPGIAVIIVKYRTTIKWDELQPLRAESPISWARITGSRQRIIAAVRAEAVREITLQAVIPPRREGNAMKI
jgi:hypothetical protein